MIARARMIFIIDTCEASSCQNVTPALVPAFWNRIFNNHEYNWSKKSLVTIKEVWYGTASTDRSARSFQRRGPLFIWNADRVQSSAKLSYRGLHHRHAHRVNRESAMFSYLLIGALVVST